MDQRLEFQVKLALFQPSAPQAYSDDILAMIAGSVAKARGRGAEIVLFPELILPGYNLPEAQAALAEPQDGPWLTALADLARRAGCALVFGWAERCGAQVFNAVTALDATGAIVAHHRKRQLFGPMEQARFAPGPSPAPVVDLAGRRCGLLICYEIEFPEYARDLARRGAEVVLVPTANPSGFDIVQDVLLPARAYENGLTIAYANYCGVQNGLEFSGDSVVVGPDGAHLARAGVEDAMLVVDLPPRQTYPSHALATQLADLNRDPD